MSRKTAKKPVAPAKKKHSGGRPTKYDPAFCKQAKRLCLLGAKNTDLAAFFEVTESTISLWMKERPEFSGAIKAGRLEADNNVANSLYRRAIGYSHPAVKIMQHLGVPVIARYRERYPPDAASMIFWLKNRRPDLWREKVELAGDPERPINITLNMSGKPDKRG